MNQLQQRRVAKGFTQQQLADELGITVSWLSKIENGKQKPNLALKVRIATVLECEITDIFLD